MTTNYGAKATRPGTLDDWWDKLDGCEFEAVGIRGEFRWDDNASETNTEPETAQAH